MAKKLDQYHKERYLSLQELIKLVRDYKFEGGSKYTDIFIEEVVKDIGVILRLYADKIRAEKYHYECRERAKKEREGDGHSCS